MNRKNIIIVMDELKLKMMALATGKRR